MRRWLYLWLPRFFGCHCRADRSFFYTWNGRRHKAPICARCTGELAGIFIGIVWCLFSMPDWRVCALLMVPLVIDGFTQLLTRYESTNFRRVVTGIAFGFGLYSLSARLAIAIFRMGYELGLILLSS